MTVASNGGPTVPAISVHSFGIDADTARRLAGAVRERVVEALPETAAACSCRVLSCVAAEWPGPSSSPRAWVEVAMFPGRSPAQKRALFQAIITGCVDCRVPADAVTIVLHEPSLENWGIRGGQAAADVFGT